MNRNALIYLNNWLKDETRKPLVLRGVRQVGKTWLVQELARVNQLKLLEFNFELYPVYKTLFSENDPKKTLLSLESYLGHSIDPRHCLLFLDEIQAMPELLAKLRWFYEMMPELAVIATGSLLEFVLEDHTFSMPVGRITYLHLEPLSFEEFLLARHKKKLLDYLQCYQLQDIFPLALHEQCLSLFKEYIFVGGLPAAVDQWVKTKSLKAVQLIHQDLFVTYHEDFSKYAKRIPISYFDEVLAAVPNMVGKKFVYQHVNPDEKIAPVKKALFSLCKARVCHFVRATYANGVPLLAEAHAKIFKVILLDTGLLSAALDLPLHQIEQAKEINLINAGAVSEHVVGQLLRCVRPLYVEPQLFYWTRESSNASAEMDYVISHHGTVIPIEVKSGSTGALKSLHYFMAEKKLSVAVRINSDVPTVTQVDVKTNIGKPVKYKLLSIPFYLTEQVHRLIGD